MNEETAPLLGALLAGELVNTVFVADGNIVDGLETSAQLRAWLRAHRSEFETPVDVADGLRLRDFHVLRGAVDDLFRALLAGEAPPSRAIRALNSFSRRAPRVLQLDWRQGREPRAVSSSLSRDLSASILGEIARSAIDFLGTPSRDQLRRCPAPGCIMYFVKDHPRREWCSERCGNRARVARHYARHRIQQ